MTDELRKPCALCGTKAEAMLTDDSCMACERDRLAAENARLRAAAEAVIAAYKPEVVKIDRDGSKIIKGVPPEIVALGEALTRKEG